MTKFQEAKKELIRFQLAYGHLISSEISLLFGNEWDEALEKDPEGSQLLPLIADWKERLTPMVLA